MGCLKDAVYCTKPATLEELWERTEVWYVFLPSTHSFGFLLRSGPPQVGMPRC